MIIDPRHLHENTKKFRTWLNTNSDSNDNNYKNHAVDVLRSWLDEKMPNLGIGNLFRFDNIREYKSFKETIVSSPSFESVNGSDMNGRPNAALNHYERYLAQFQPGELNRQLCAQIPQSGPRVICGTFRRRGQNIH